MRKGISPLIATVLLIAFTISIGAIIGAWVTSFSKGKTDDLGKNSASTFNCAQSSIKFETTDIGVHRIAVTNTGNIDLTGFKITVQNGTGETATLTQTIPPEVNSTNPLRPGDKRVLSNVTMDVGNKITVTSKDCISATYTQTKVV